MALRKMAVLACAGGALALASCSSSPAKPQSSATTTTSGRQTTTTTAAAGPQNLTVTDQLRTSLVAAFAAAHSLPVSDYTGLQPGKTYYALDPSTMTYWAGASVVPSSSSTDGQVSTQDDGSYAIFSEPSSGGTWKVADVGATGEQGSSCPAGTIPATIVALWNWAPGSCLPPN